MDLRLETQSLFLPLPWKDFVDTDDDDDDDDDSCNKMDTLLLVGNHDTFGAVNKVAITMVELRMAKSLVTVG